MKLQLLVIKTGLKRFKTKMMLLVIQTAFVQYKYFVRIFGEKSLILQFYQVQHESILQVDLIRQLTYFYFFEFITISRLCNISI